MFWWAGYWYLASQAIRKYIAGFADSAPQLGHAAPCRSYRSLVCFEDFSEYSNDISKAKSREDIVGVQNSMKAFKTAYTDLLGMCKSACSRLY